MKFKTYINHLTRANGAREAALVCSLCLCFTCLTGCAAAAATSTQPTLEELMAEVNAAHQSVERGEIDPTPYLRTETDLISDEERYNYYLGSFECAPPAELTKQQAVEDVEYLFDTLYNIYPLYDYFGGKEAFDEAENAILQQCEETESITAEEFQNILLEQLSFLKDGHFHINYNFANPVAYPFFFRETAFQKTESGYQTADGKTVESVEGYDALDALFKRSISSEGELVYYPILLKTAYEQDEEKNTLLCDETLTVHYTDGTSEELVSEPYQIYEADTNEIVSMQQDGDIPVMQLNSWSTKYQDEIMDGAAQLKNSAVSIFDLRNNPGGDGTLVKQWFSSYCGRVPSNGIRVYAFTGERFDKLLDHWVDHEDLLIVLTGKGAGSASESFVDTAYNLENVLIIGENTRGALIGGGGAFQLPNSQFIVNSGGITFYMKAENNDYYEELRGFYPDIWVPAAEAEELAVKLMEQLKK